MDKKHSSCCCAPHEGYVHLIDKNEKLPVTKPQVEEKPDNSPHASYIFYGKIKTMDNNNPEVEAMAIKHNKIIALGTKAEIKKHKGLLTKEIDLGNSVMYPGLIEPHMHLWSTAINYNWIDCSAFNNKTVNDVLNRIKEAVNKAKPGEFIYGKLYDPSLFPGLKELTIKDLDPISPNNPVFIFNASQHFAYVNTLALKRVGYDDNTPNPKGGTIGRDKEGHLNGIIGEISAITPFMKTMNKLSVVHDLIKNIESITKDASSVGVTTMREAATGALLGKAEISILQIMKDLGQLKTRLSIALLNDKASVWESDLEKFACGKGDDLLHIGAWKIVGDGSNQGKSGYFKEPYLHDTSCGSMDITQEEIEERIKWCEKNNFQVMIHANGDKAVETAVNSYFNALNGKKSEKELRHRIEHCSFIDNDKLFEKMKEVNISPSFLINHVYFWGKTLQKNILGEARTNNLDRIGTALKYNLVASMHSDYNVSPINPLHYVKVATTRTMWDGGEILNKDEIISVKEGMEVITKNAAWQLRMEDKIGTLEVGKYADMVVFDKDPIDTEPEKIDGIKIKETWMNGKQTYKLK